MLSGLCAEAACHQKHCKMQVFLLHDPDICQYEMTLELEYLCSCYCAQRRIWSRSSTGSRTCRSSPGCIHFRFLCGGFLCRWRPCLSQFPASPPPSNNESLSRSPCTTPGMEYTKWQIKRQLFYAWFITAGWMRFYRTSAENSLPATAQLKALLSF